MARGPTPRLDNEWSDDHLAYLAFMAIKAIKRFGGWRHGFTIDELISVGWLRALRTRTVDQIPGSGRIAYLHMWQYMKDNCRWQTAQRHKTNPVTVARFSDIPGLDEETDEDCLDALAVDDPSLQSVDECDWLRWALRKCNCRETEAILRAIVAGETLDAVAQTMGCTRERVRQIKEAGLRKVERSLRDSGLYQ